MTIELATISRVPLSGSLNRPRLVMSAMMMKVSTKAQAAAMTIMEFGNFVGELNDRHGQQILQFRSSTGRDDSRPADLICRRLVTS